MKDKSIFKIFFGYTLNVAVAYFRMISYAMKMRKRKDTEVYFFDYDYYDDKVCYWQNQLSNPQILNKFDLIFKNVDISVIQPSPHLQVAAMVMAAKEKYGKPILMEIDDYILTLPSSNAACGSYTPGGNNEYAVLEQMKASDGVIVSTNALKELYGKYNKNIYVVPNGLDMDLWTKCRNENKKNEKIRIGFGGSPNHKDDIREIRDVIYFLLDKYPDIEFHFLMCNPEFLKGNKRIIMTDKWIPLNEYPSFMSKEARFDIGIAPLRDTNFNRGKSNLRFLEMGMLKVPTVATDCGSYNSDIVNYQNGFLCKDKEDWIKYLSLLIENKKIRKVMGDNAYKYVNKNYDVKNIADNYRELLDKLAREGIKNEPSRN